MTGFLEQARKALGDHFCLTETDDHGPQAADGMLLRCNCRDCCHIVVHLLAELERLAPEAVAKEGD